MISQKESLGNQQRVSSLGDSLFERRAHSRGGSNAAWQSETQIRVNVAARMREMWN
jgi:hypothetical protein